MIKTIHNKKIAFIGQKGIPAEFAGTSGIEFYVENLAKTLINQRNKIYCYVRNWATPKKIKKHQQIELIHLPSINTKHLDAFSHSLLSSIHVCFTKADIVWYQAIGPAFFSFLPKIFGKTIYTTIHGLDWQREKWGWWAKIFIKFCEKIAVRFSDKIFVVSKELQDYFWKKYHKKTHLQQHTIPKLKKLKPKNITNKYGLKGNDYLLFMGRFVPEKRIDWIIKAYLKIKPENIKLVLAGGPSHTGKYAKKLYKLAKKEKDIVFTGYVFGREKHELLSNCKLFILPSSLEGSSIALREALSFKRPCFLSDIQSHKELVKKDLKINFFKKHSFGQFTEVLKEVI